ncbi:MAG: nucleotidyltransferase family protein [Legionella sp.]|nr:nucleotidyltransferase family protein [Legionella sp.]
MLELGNEQIAETASVQTWQKAMLPANATLQQAICNLDETALQVVLVIAPDGTLLGTITDGDIRRGLLRGLTMESLIDGITHREPLVVPKQLNRDTVLQLMQANKIHQLPIVDNERRVVGLHLWDELAAPTLRPNLMVIMAGGQGLRLRPHTENCPKPMLLVSGKPMLEHIIERAKAEGFHHFIVAIHYLGHMIEDYFGDGSLWQVKIDYLREKSPLGTAGAVGLLNPRPDSPFLVSNGDVLTDIRYGELLDFHCRHQAAATMAVRLHEWQNPFGVVHTRGVDILNFEEKPISRTHINSGIYVLEPEALTHLQANEHCDMPTLFTRLKDKMKRTIVYPMHEPWLDVGREDDLRKANLEGVKLT